MNWVHIHLAVNHVPVLGTMFLLILLIVGLVRKSDDLKRIALWGFVLLALLAVPIKYTGDLAFERMEAMPQSTLCVKCASAR